MLKKRLTAFLLSVMTICSTWTALATEIPAGDPAAQTVQTEEATPPAAPFTLNSAAAVVMDADTGSILYEQNADTRYPMASITKTMTALIVFEKGDLSATTTATADALNLVDLDSTRIGFVEGENLTIDELMYCMLVYSANDAANILAAAVAGDVPTFVAMMNEKAKELGCTNTHFANPNGLDEDEHYTTARDMAVITRAANQYPEFAKYSGAVSYELPSDNIIEAGWWIKTKVDMYDQSKECYDPRIYAAKTGYTTNAHNTFVAVSKSDSAHLIISLLCCPIKSGIFVDTKTLVDHFEGALTSLTIQPEEYMVAAKNAADTLGYDLDISAVQPIVLRVAEGITADDLDYTAATDAEGNACLEITLKEKSRSKMVSLVNSEEAYVLGHSVLPVKERPVEKSEVGSGSAAVGKRFSLPFGDKLAQLEQLLAENQPLRIGVLVGSAAVILFLLILIRRAILIRARKKRKMQRMQQRSRK